VASCPTTPCLSDPRCCHTAHREQIYDWPNLFEAGTKRRPPVAGPVDDRLLGRRSATGRSNQQTRFVDLVDGDSFKIVFDRDDVVVRSGSSVEADRRRATIRTVGPQTSTGVPVAASSRAC
jgi:hypothetical protein